MRRWTLGGLAALVATALVAVGAAGITYASLKVYLRKTASPRPPAVLRKLAALPDSGNQKYIGVYEPSAFTSYTAVSNFATALGTQPNVVSYFSGWGEGFQVAFAQRAHAHGAIPLVQINPYGVEMASIAKGVYDKYLISYARQVAGYGHPVIIGFAHEMNGWWYPWGWTKTPPSQWVAAWRHVVTVFRRWGASNVTWLWTINRGVSGKMAPLKDYWPGANYVSWVGIDGYYYNRNQTFLTNFLPTIQAVRKMTTAPIFLGEVGIGQVAGQARSLPGLFAGIKRWNLAGLLWYDVSQHGGAYHQDWRLEGHKSAIAAFRRGMRYIGYH